MEDVYLMTIGDKEIKVFIQSKNTVKDVDYGKDGEKFVGVPFSKVCVAQNNRFFMVAIPDTTDEEKNTHVRAIGFFGLERNHYTVKPLKWISKYPFKQIYVDEHLSTMMLLDEKRKQLDYFYILWKFDTDRIPDKQKLLDIDKSEQFENDTEPNMDLQDGMSKSEVQRVKSTACCSIF